MNVGEVCNREVVIVQSSDSILDAAKLMREHHAGDVVVVEDRDGQRFPVGILTDRDIVIEILAKDLNPDAISIGDAMSFELLTVMEEDAVMETVKRMREKGVRRIPVVNQDGSLEGILRVDDLIDLLAEQVNDIVGLITYEQWREREKIE
ncbi:MAG: CBS domain-containing protein [Desulfobulbaceae bacterium]|nr:CBS domain-containing protein [Desulfobulbaceae bacterium]